MKKPIAPICLVHDYEQNKDIELPITVGMKATQFFVTDSYACEVIELISDKVVKIREMHSKRVDTDGPFTEMQTYEYTSNPEGRVYMAKKTKTGWRWGSESVTTKSCRVGFGFARTYCDPHF